jgi:hypothetical protein
MAITRDGRTFAQRYLEVICRCGRTLRASIESAGSTIQCWDCKAVVPVPVPRARLLAARVMLRGLGDVFSVPAMVSLLVATVVLVGLLTVPFPGLVKAFVVFGLLGVGYGMLIRRAELASIGAVAGVVLGLLTLPVMLLAMVPWLVLRGSGGMSRPPVLVWPGVAILAAVAVALPLLLLVLWAPRRLEAVRSLVWHPFATLLALAVVPLGLIAAEVLAIVVSSWLGWFAFYVVALFPNTETIAPRFGINGANYNTVYFVDSKHMSLYHYYLAHGVPLSSALPASLDQPRYGTDRPYSIETGDHEYLIVRAVHTAVMVIIWLGALTLQAHWLALIARLEVRFPPVKAEPMTASAEGT